MASSEAETPMSPTAAIAVMKATNGFGLNDSPSGRSSGRSEAGFSRAGSVSRAGASRTYTRSSRRSMGTSTVVSAHRRQMAAELTSQAESKFLALMDLIASASREASSLRESWSRVISEREASNAERDELLEQITEVSEELEQHSKQRDDHGAELEQKRKHVETVLAELAVAAAAVATHKKRAGELDLELARSNDELRVVRETFSRTRIEHDKSRSELESLELALATAQTERDGAQEDASRHHRDLQRLVREKADVESRYGEVSASHDVARKDVSSLTERVKTLELENGELSGELERLREELRLARLRAEESAKEYADITEKHERAKREAHQLRESIRAVHAERDDLVSTIEKHNRSIKTLTASRDEHQHRHTDAHGRLEGAKRELLGLRERLRAVELERNEHVDTAERTREQSRLTTLERDELRDEVGALRRKHEETHGRVSLLTAALRKAEQGLADSRSEGYAHLERHKLLERERDDWRGRHASHATELAALTERFALVTAELGAVKEAHDLTRGELDRRNEEFEEITETVTSTNDESAQLSFELESLRTLLRESREQKERAIAARAAADRERDEFVAKYEEKCREMERYEEEAASYYHANASSRSGGETRTTTSRIVSRGGGSSSSHHASSQQQSSSQTQAAASAQS